MTPFEHGVIVGIAVGAVAMLVLVILLLPRAKQHIGERP